MAAERDVAEMAAEMRDAVRELTGELRAELGDQLPRVIEGAERLLAVLEDISEQEPDDARARWQARPPVLAIDVDGVLASYDGWRGHDIIGDPVPGAREFLQDMRADGWGIIVHSCRTAERVIQWARRHGLHELIDGYNTNPWFDDAGLRCSGKPPADVYLDDRAVTFLAEWEGCWVAAKRGILELLQRRGRA